MMEFFTTYGTVQVKKCRARASLDSPDSNAEEITSEGDVETGLPEIQPELSGTGVNAGSLAGRDGYRSQPEGPHNILGLISIVDIAAPIGVPGMMFFLQANLHMQTSSEKMENENLIFWLIAMAHVLQIAMGTILLLKALEKIYCNSSMPRCMLVYQILSAVVAGLQAFVLASPLLFGKNSATGKGFNPVVFFQAAVLLSLRIAIFLVVEKIRKAYGNYA